MSGLCSYLPIKLSIISGKSKCTKIEIAWPYSKHIMDNLTNNEVNAESQLNILRKTIHMKDWLYLDCLYQTNCQQVED